MPWSRYKYGVWYFSAHLLNSSASRAASVFLYSVYYFLTDESNLKRLGYEFMDKNRNPTHSDNNTLRAESLDESYSTVGSNSIQTNNKQEILLIRVRSQVLSLVVKRSFREMKSRHSHFGHAAFNNFENDWCVKHRLSGSGGLADEYFRSETLEYDGLVQTETSESVHLRLDSSERQLEVFNLHNPAIYFEHLRRTWVNGFDVDRNL